MARFGKQGPGGVPAEQRPDAVFENGPEPLQGDQGSGAAESADKRPDAVPGDQGSGAAESADKRPDAAPGDQRPGARIASRPWTPEASPPMPNRAGGPVAAVAAESAEARSDSSRVPTRVTATEPPLIDVRDLRVWYAGLKGPVQAVDGVWFSLKRGEVLGLVGESGCGKSTLGRALLGLRPAGSGMDGEIHYRGNNLVALRPKAWSALRGAGLGMIFQEPMTRLDPLMRISDHFREGLRAHAKISRREADRRALESLRSLGIPPSRYKNYPHEFSGGMRQRIMIALALSMRPEFVVADEPTTALDVLVEAQIVKILGEIRNTFSPAMLLITHNLGIVGQACDRVAVMYAGRIVEQGTVDRVFSAPAHPYTRELLGATISLTTTELRTIPGAPPDLADPPPGCRFHPRCPFAMAVCRERMPPTTEPSPGQFTECHLVGANGLTEAERAPLERAEVSVADEA